jgi:hypothetical protein
MAVRIFLAMGSLLIKEMRRSGVWHFWHITSIPNTRRKRSDHLMYFALLMGLSWPAWLGAASGTAGVNHLFAGRGVRGEHAAVKDGMPPGSWHEGRQTSDESEGR